LIKEAVQAEEAARVEEAFQAGEAAKVEAAVLEKLVAAEKQMAEVAVQVGEPAGTGCCCAEVKEQLCRIESLLLTLTIQFNYVPIPEIQNFVPSVSLPTYLGVVLLPEESSLSSDVVKDEEQGFMDSHKAML